MRIVIGLISLIVFVVFLIKGIDSLIQKNGNSKKFLISSAAFLIITVIAFMSGPSSKTETATDRDNSSATTETVANNTNTSQETTDNKAQEDQKAKEEEARAKAEAEAKAKAEAEAKAKAEAEAKAKRAAGINFKGSGDTATDFFELSPGLAFIDATHSGSSNFVIKFMDESEKKKLLVNEIGKYKGKTLVRVNDEGKYLLNINADGSWKINVTQEPPEDIKSTPASFNGKGDSVLFVNMNSGLARFTYKHDGESNFIVKVNDKNVLVNEIGKYTGTSAETLRDTGMYVISVNADGAWSIDISQ
ncbi:hypothetical protein ACM1RC_32800 [Paenibacillus azoreducens]|uniref:hypothetical protein n=1 Tax=Paenibacillus azoreducens TaxID=116718 RepID=UPI0039F60A9B